MKKFTYYLKDGLSWSIAITIFLIAGLGGILGSIYAVCYMADKSIFLGLATFFVLLSIACVFISFMNDWTEKKEN